jgi:hypothetical protein
MTENGWGYERQINGKPATSILVTGGERGLKQKPSANGCSLNDILSKQPAHQL